MRRPFRRADRDVLQVGVGRRQPAGRRHRLVIRGVHAAGARVDLLRQLVGVGRAQLGQAAVVEDQPRQLVAPRPVPPARPRRWTAGRSASCASPAGCSLSNRISCSCLGESRLNGWPGRRMRALFELEQCRATAPGSAARSICASISTPQCSIASSTGTSGCSMLGVELRQRRHGFELRPQRAMQPQRDVGVLGRVLGRRARPAPR